MCNRRGDEVKVGDTLRTWFNGGQAQVRSLRPYIGPLIDLLGEGSQVAEFYGCRVEMTLSAKTGYEVLA